jgi:hypothetical protein
MKISRVFLALLFLAFLLLVPFAVEAATKAATPPPPPDVRILIASVEAADNSVVIVYKRNKEIHTYKIDGVTAVKVNGKTGSFADIKSGMEVQDLVERDNDSLDSLSVISSTAAPVAKKK